MDAPLVWFGAHRRGRCRLERATAHVVDRMGTEKAVAISATLLFLYCVGAIIGPLTAAGLMTHFGDPMLFVQNGVLHVVICGYVLSRWFADGRHDAER